MDFLTMEHKIQLRPATLEDARILFAWRNDKLSRLASHQTQEISYEEHLNWLSTSLSNPLRKLAIAAYQSDVIGTVRADYVENKNIWLLSWTLAPEKRGQGLSKYMVKAFTKTLQGDCCAEIKATNLASIKIAEYLGLSLQETKQDILYFSSKSTPNIEN